MRDKTHRIGTLIVLLLSFFVAIIIYMGLNPLIYGPQNQEIAAIIAFSAGLFLNTSYLIFSFKNVEHDDTRLNVSTQIWFGLILIFASLVTLILIGFLEVAFSTALIWMSGVTLILLYVSIDKFDEYLEKETGHQIKQEIKEEKKAAPKKKKKKSKK